MSGQDKKVARRRKRNRTRGTGTGAGAGTGTGGGAGSVAAARRAQTHTGWWWAGGGDCGDRGPHRGAGGEPQRKEPVASGCRSDHDSDESDQHRHRS